MKPLIAVVDYEMGNLHSVAKALEKAGARVQVTSSGAALERADGIVLPGVGAFGEAAKRLRRMKLVSPILKSLEKNKPFLGICLGLQLLFEQSDENPGVKGLGFFKGKVTRFKWPKSSSLKIPHMGWNTIQLGPAKTRVLNSLKEGRYFYFVHSFFPAPKDQTLVATRTHYGRSFCSSIASGRLFASQFHPEKSGDQGHRLLTNFVHEVGQC